MKPGSRRACPNSRPLPNLQRQTFTTSRLLDYFSKKELTLQTGHDEEQWPQVALKELVDNALDAAEEAGISPKISVCLKPDALSVTDNGPGIAAEVVGRILDFSSKTTSKDYYVSPTRGAQGNAMKTLLAIPYVLSEGMEGRVEISAQGTRHVLKVEVDRIQQIPRIHHEQKRCDVRTGTVVELGWPGLACSDQGGGPA